MTLTESTYNGRPQLHMSGELTVFYVGDIKDRLMHYARDYTYLAVNLGEVSEIDTAGVQLLVLFKREGVKKSHTIVFNTPSQAIIDMAELLHMRLFFDLGESRQ